MNKKSIILIGFMGVGKTTLGQELAQKLQRPFIDIDHEIEKVYQMRTVDIFKEHGEAAFRKTEKELILQACEQEDKVISIGGGAFLQEDIRNHCLKHAIVIFLDISWTYWKERIDLLIDTRPILQNKDLNEIEELFNDRQAIYQSHHIHVKLDDLGIQEAVEKIIEGTQGHAPRPR